MTTETKTKLDELITAITAFYKKETTDIINKIPIKTSQLTNDSGYLTEHQSLADYVKKNEIPTVPPALKNPNVLTIKIGDTTYTYDGSEPIIIEIPSI